MCRAIKVLCVANDPELLLEVKRAVVGAEWELCAGAVGAVEASAQLEAERPHILVVWGAFDELVGSAREGWPALRIVTDRELPEADAVVASLGQLREAIRATPHPGGPVR